MGDSYYTTEEQIKQLREEIRIAKLRKKRRSAEKNTIKGRNAKEKHRSSLNRLSSAIAFSILLVLLTTVLVSVLVQRSSGKIPDILGFQLFVIRSGSMKPTLGTGSLILSKKPPSTETLKAGDIVTFKSLSGSIVTHRIISVDKNESGKVIYHTKGDNPINSPDRDTLSPDRVISVMLFKVF